MGWQFKYTFANMNAETMPPGNKTFFILISTEHEIPTTYENKNAEKLRVFLALRLSDAVSIQLIIFNI